MILHSTLPLPKIIAHRGASAHAPENTLAALRKAAEMGASWVEFDVMLTADGVPIVMHDETLSRTTNGRGVVADTTYACIKTLDAGSWFSPVFSGEKVPMLSEFLEMAHQLGLGLNLEIKSTRHNASQTGEAVADTIRKYWPAGSKSLLISSGCVDSLSIRPIVEMGFPLALILDKWVSGWQEMVTSLNCISLHVHHRMLTPERMREARRFVRYVLAYTVNNVATARRCYELGAEAIFSDYPNLLV
ncbi:MAG: putative glycerophosphoryl diester phosphodiesterase [Gammaproteobacteria bacterium]|jgi:glycerophosphoryl diester phosphodiesterase|nr:putative glycerophosphoryl diester phosphodiesterase [Gammaproteobacteria bacterium]